MTEEESHEALERLVARGLVDRGELVPTTTEEVLDARLDDVELPASLASLYDGDASPRVRAPAQREPARRARALVGGAVAFAAAIAAVAAWLALRPAPLPISGDTSLAPSSPPARSAEPAPSAWIEVARPTCTDACCGGKDCATPRASLAVCPTERTCVACAGHDAADTLYRVRLGDLAPSGDLPPSLDLCVKIGASRSGAWSCAPARAPSAVRPRGRWLATASRVGDLEGGVALELRADGKVHGRWWSTLAPTAAQLCLGTRVTFEDDQKRPVGTLSMFLERTYFVELARAPREADLDDAARAFSFQGLAARHLTAAREHVLALGPFDRSDAEHLLEALRARAPADGARPFRVDAGDAYEDAW